MAFTSRAKRAKFDGIGDRVLIFECKKCRDHSLNVSPNRVHLLDITKCLACGEDGFENWALKRTRKVMLGYQ